MEPDEKTYNYMIKAAANAKNSSLAEKYFLAASQSNHFLS